MSAGGQTGASRTAIARLGGFTAFVWIAGLVVAGIVALVYADEGGFDVGAVGVDEDYASEPWTSPDPIVADDRGGGVYEGSDGAVIRLSGLDVDAAVVLTPEDSTYLGGVRVTGPGGRIVTEGEYGEPPRFSSLADGRVVVLVEQPDVELWVDGFSDETWRARVTTGGLGWTNDVASGFESAVFTHAGEASTARLSARGEGSIAIQIVTPHGSERTFDGEAPLDQSIAWPDAPLVVFSVESWDDVGWKLEFPPTPTPTPTLSPSPSPGATP
ncbi:hypothetical protein Q9S71_04620 [Microbacterium sp. KSW4-11]|uniref:Uncharacterized protein n=1 Tax=Microbacterium gawkjiense TaxID=3067309 RepID=A0ABU3G9F8_9MICO|nr:hypothetical protein [Microbacterium sp. KSW4-11]MDT3316101.1 hypothetical protein [Microbacterium sp. KSW4-11]